MRFLISLTFISIISLFPHSEVFANTYKPDKRYEQQQTQSTTNRGCRESVAQFQILAPSDHIGKTALKQPTFLFWWYEVPSSSLKISITQPLVESPLWEKPLEVEQKGLLRLKLPESLKLKNGDYVLTAELPCSSQADGSSFIRIAFRKVSLNEGDSSKSLAERGIWYDALVESLKTSKTEFHQLLEQIGIILSNEDFSDF
ncbi:hypothetical protein cce_4929 [Crocosphaera subtropica ATCC 51142]|uniref:DUF928-containing protein n=1 Tax=Crocosphaera subtropica (strain ATCC 51142 / BH68) TaxID=43989 RepID=B1X2B4_CROS5|nr:DUF928 domain-containing protein [Crocosphaera subtropica]ACB54275.1 hypothetical protein cce_4929 [Crocosphaera subtropica ATCC 51142]